MSNAIVLLTALVPTKGHKYLIDFASNLIGPSDKVYVILNSMDDEPINGQLRADALKLAFREKPRVHIEHLHGDVPQNPEDHPDFWNFWGNLVNSVIKVNPEDYFVASELYGLDMAKVLGCKFMPCDMKRQTLYIKGTTVRNDIFNQFANVLPEFQHNLTKTVTIFGAESCGKTTMARSLAANFNGYFIPEYARDYLELLGPEVTDDRMMHIVAGQIAYQQTVQDFKDKVFTFQDTDLLSTVGYFRIFGGDKRAPMDSIEIVAKYLKSDLYFVMNDDIPFEKDILRFGDGVRESKTKFWTDLLNEFGCNYVEVPLGTHMEQELWCEEYLLKWYDKETNNFRTYVRS